MGMYTGNRHTNTAGNVNILGVPIKPHLHSSMQGPWFQLTKENTVCLHFIGSSGEQMFICHWTTSF